MLGPTATATATEAVGGAEGSEGSEGSGSFLNVSVRYVITLEGRTLAFGSPDHTAGVVDWRPCHLHQFPWAAEANEDKEGGLKHQIWCLAAVGGRSEVGASEELVPSGD